MVVIFLLVGDLFVLVVVVFVVVVLVFSLFPLPICILSSFSVFPLLFSGFSILCLKCFLGDLIWSVVFLLWLDIVPILLFCCILIVGLVFVSPFSSMCVFSSFSFLHPPLSSVSDFVYRCTCRTFSFLLFLISLDFSHSLSFFFVFKLLYVF
eukprot:TRINITY_DN3252_c1_g2_i4.p1 TRINITY_DN3252_c1_g2~~TRINITY_DN3252_c1_g2_i4.p1  ORF type:complete len:152 (+),score=10.03 TRINITY_DN3252_c1_g2_i4:98-553(+)